MGVCLQRGQSAGPEDLTVYIQRDGLPVTPYSLVYTVYDRTSGSEVQYGDARQTALESSPGNFYAPVVIPLSANIGEWVIKWFIQETDTSTEITQFLKFGVVSENFTSDLDLSDCEKELLSMLRTVLRDNNPDRNYHFAPPTREVCTSEYTTRYGYLWEDQELLQHMQLAICTANMRPPTNSFPCTVAEYCASNCFIPVVGGAASAVRAIALNWIEEEFGYSIGGISLDLSKAGLYMQMKDNLEEQFNTVIEDYLKNGGAAIIKGLSQPFYGVGFTTALGPSVREGVVSARAFVNRRRR
jgi:hypothetical protein